MSGVGGKSYLVVRQNRYGTFFLIRRYRVNRDRIPGINGHLSVVVIPAQACGSAILGGVFGLASFLRCFGLNAFGAMLLSINLFLAFLLYVPTRILTGWMTGLIYQGIRRTKIPSNVSLTIANLCCPLLNTTFFMSMLVFGFYQTEYIQSFVQKFGVSNPFLFVIAFVGINGLVEAAVCFIVGTAISAALKRR